MLQVGKAVVFLTGMLKYFANKFYSLSPKNRGEKNHFQKSNPFSSKKSYNGSWLVELVNLGTDNGEGRCDRVLPARPGMQFNVT